MNIVVVTGHLGRDPIMEMTRGGTSVAKLTIADNINKDDVQWVPVTCYGKLAEAVGQYCNKGHKVTIYGKIAIDRYEKDGDSRYYTKIIADRAEF